MLFQSQVPLAFKKLAVDYAEAAAVARKKEAAKRLAYYHGEALSHLEDILSKMFHEPDRLQKLTLNVVAKIINNLAALYRIPPVRELEGSQADQKVYGQICEACQVDLKLKTAHRYARLLKSLLIRVLWRAGRIDLDILTPNILDVEIGDTPADLQSILITDFGISTRPEDVTFSLWTPETWSRLDYRGNVIEQEPNPYAPVMPFVPIFDSLPVNSDFFQPGGEDLVLIQEAVNVKLLDLLHILHHQAFGVGFIKNQAADPLTEESPLLYGPGSLVELSGEKSEIGFVSQKSDIRGLLLAIDKLIKWAAVSYGLSAQVMSTDPTSESGLSKIWSSTELSEKRSEDKILCRGYEARLFDMIRVVHNTHSSEKLSDTASVKVNFSDPSQRPTTSLLDMAEADWLKYRMGTLSPVDIVMREDSDLTSRAEAAERLRQIRAERKEFGPPEESLNQPSSTTTRQTRR